MTASVATFYSPLDCPVARTFWTAATDTPADTWSHTTWKVAKFILLFLPALAATVLDLTVFNFFRCTMGNLYILMRGKKVEQTTLESIVSFFKENRKELVIGCATLAALGVSIWMMPKFWDLVDSRVVSILPKAGIPGIETNATNMTSLVEGSMATPLGTGDIISGWFGALAAKIYYWADIKGVPSTALSGVQRGWQHAISPTLSFADNACGGWLSTLILRAPWVAAFFAMPFSLLYYNDPSLQTQFPNFSRYLQFLGYAMKISFWNFLWSPFLSAPSPTVGIYAGVQNWVRQPLFLAGFVLRWGSVVPLTFGSYWITAKLLGEQPPSLKELFTNTQT